MKRLMRYKVAVVMALSGLLALALPAATRVWSQTDGVWSTDPQNTPFTGRSFADGDAVVFNDPENLSIDEQLTANVTVHGIVLPSYVTFNNDSTIYMAHPDGEDASIGLNEELGRVQIVTKNGTAPVTIDTPLCYENVVVNQGTLTLNDMPGAANTITLMPGTTFNFRYTGTLAQPLFSGYTMEPGSTFHRLGTANFGDAYFPQPSSTETFKPGSRALFDDLRVTGLMYVYNGVYIEALESADLHGLEVWSNGVFRMTGKMEPSHTNTIGTIDVLCGGKVQLNEGYFRVGSLTTNDTVSAQVASGSDDGGRLVVGGDPADTNRTYFVYDSPPGIVYTQNEFIGNTMAEMPEVTVGGEPAVNSYLYVTNGANLEVHGRLVFGGGDAPDRLRRLTIADNAKVCVDGYLDLTEVTNYAGKVDARILVTNNSVFSTAGIKYGPKDLSGNKTRQVKVMDGSTFELGGDNDGENIAGVNLGTDKRKWELGEHYTGADHSRAFILDNSTLRFTEDQIFNQTIFLQEARTNVFDLAGHVVTNCASINPYYAGGDDPIYSEAGWCCNRFEICDTSPEQNGYLYLDVPHYSIRNGYSGAIPDGYVRKQYGTQLISGRLRLNPDKGEDCGFSLRGGILDIPVGKDHPAFVVTNYTDLCTATRALACIWDSEIGATIRCYCSSRDQLVKYSETNTWQLVCEVITSQNPRNNFYDGIPIDKFLRTTAFQLIEESTGEMLPGATFCAWPLQKRHHQSEYDKYTDYRDRLADYNATKAAYEAATDDETVDKESEDYLALKSRYEELAAWKATAKAVSKPNDGWWYVDDTTTNRYAILMRYEDKLDRITDLYWQGATGSNHTWSDYNDDDWFDPNGKGVRYGDGANVYITNLTESLTINLDRTTELTVEEILLGPDRKPLVDESGLVVTNFYPSGYEGQKPVSVQTLNISDCMSGVTIDATNTLVTTYGISVTNAVATIEGYAVVDGGIEVIGPGSYLTITQLVHRSTWYVGPDATFHAGYADPEVWFSTMSHTITNYGTVVYNLNGRTEHITQLLTYPEGVPLDADDGNLCHYEFENGVMEFYGTDYLTRRANTNVWISAGCTRRITGTTGTSVAAATSYSPMGYKNGGLLEVDIPYRSSRGSVLMNQASIQLNDVFTMIPGSSISVIEHVNDESDPENVIDWSGEIFVRGNEKGALNFADNPAGSATTFETSPFRFYTAAGETNHVDVALTGTGNIVVEGGGTLFLGDRPSTVSGKLTVKSGAVLVVEGPESLGYLDVTVEDGGTIIFQETGRPQKYCKSVTMETGSAIGLGPTTGVIEPQNPVRILELGVLTMPQKGVDAISRLDGTNVPEHLKEVYGLVDAASQSQPDLTTRRYTKARSFQSQYVELFGLLGELVWDTDTPTGTWFSLDTPELETPNLSFWHKAKSVNTLLGYAEGAPFENFMNILSNSVTFISAAEVEVKRREGEDETAADVYPSGIIFGAPAVSQDRLTTTVYGGTIGSDDSRAVVLATQGTVAGLYSPVWIRNLTVDKNSYLRVPKLNSTPGLTVIEDGSRLAVGGATGTLEWDARNITGSGRLDKIGAHNMYLQVDGRDVVPNPIGIGEGLVRLYGSSPTRFQGGLFFAHDIARTTTSLLTLNNRAGAYGWVSDGSVAPFTITVDDDAKLSGHAFGVKGRVNIKIAPDKTFYIDMPVTEFEDEKSFIDVSGGTIRFATHVGQGEAERYDSRIDLTFRTNNTVVLNTAHLHAQNALFQGRLVVLHGDRNIGLPDLLATNRLDKVYRITFPGYEEDEVLYDFPMPVKVDKASFTPADIIACDELGREIPCEFDSEMGDHLLFWVSVPKLEKGTSMVYLGLSKTKLPAGVRQRQPGEVWKDYFAVWHMNVAMQDGELKMQDSTTNAFTAVYATNGAGGNFNPANYENWLLSEAAKVHLGTAFQFNARGVNDTDYYNCFSVTAADTEKLMKQMSGADGVVTEGILTVEESKTSSSYQKLLCYCPISGSYSFSWQTYSADARYGMNITYLNSDNQNTQPLNTAAYDTPQRELGKFFFTGTVLNAGSETSWINSELVKTNKTYESGSSSNNPVTNRMLSNDLWRNPTEATRQHLTIGGRIDTAQVAQAFCGKIDEIRIRRRQEWQTEETQAAWMRTVYKTAFNLETCVDVEDLDVDVISAVCATESVRFGVDSTIEIHPNCVGDRSLLVDLTNGENENAKLVTPSADASVNIDISSLGELTDDMDGLKLVRIHGIRSVNIFAFQLVMDETKNADPSKWALRAVSTAEGVDIELVKAQGAVLVISPAKAVADEDWPADDDPILSPSARTFATSGEDFAILSHNFNVGTNLHDGAIIRDTYTGHVDGVTTHQITQEMTTTYTPNTDYWFWFEGSNGAWSEKANYRLHVREDGDVPEDAVCYVQFAVTNQIFYGQATDTLNSGELGFYVNYNMDTGKTNLVARILNTTAKVELDVGGITDPWLVVTVTTVPYQGYRIDCNGNHQELSTAFAERPKHLRITGIAPVDNLFISLGNPNREKIVYVHDMTVVGTGANGEKIWADCPIDCSETYQEKIVRAAGDDAKFIYRKPTQENPTVQMLPVAFHSKVRRIGAVRDSDEPKSGMMGATGSEHLGIIDLLALTPSVAKETVKATSKKFENLEMDVYCYDYEYALGIHSVNRYVNNSVSIFSVLSDVADSYDEEHLLGTAEEPHKLNGYLYIEATESPTPYSPDTVWKPVSVSSLPQFGDKHLNETFVAAPIVHSNQTYRVRVHKTRPTITKPATRTTH